MSVLDATWMNEFPELAAIDDPVWRQTAATARLVTVDPGTVLFRDGDACAGYVLVLDGSVRVQKMDPNGREIVLYRVEHGQTCMLTTSCLLGGTAYPAEGVAEERTRLAMLPAAAFDRAVAESAAFRRFVLSAISRRIADLMVLIEDVAFGRMDIRLARLLLRRADVAGVLAATHQELAVELGTAREVVSRLLKDFEARGLVRLRRAEVDVVNRAHLEQMVVEKK
jgi:CRP/FNR family transcriptional regulator, anaerobic regulatory protein